MKLDQLSSYLNDFLSVDSITDYSPNGLQVEGRGEIKKIVTGVTACLPLFEEAVARDADAIIVHHGFFWKNDSPCITGQFRKRLDVLIKNNVSLLGYHLPLDVHPEVGNNAQIAKIFDLKIQSKLAELEGLEIGLVGHLKKPMSGEAFAEKLNEKLDREPFYIPGASNEIKTIAWCTGAAQGFIKNAITHEVDAYLTGEVSEQTFHAANESGIHFYAAGHHATERCGVAALGEHLAKKFKLTHEFIDIPNPV